jgi:D-methionine transport system ATP-binding protein
MRIAESGDAAAPVIRLQNVDKIYPAARDRERALQGIDLSVQPGEVFGIIGRSGAGKSTLLKLLNLLERPTSGKVFINGQDIAALTAADLRRMRQKIGVVFQHFNLLGSRTVYENVRLPLRVAGKLSADEQRLRVHEVLDLVGLANHVHAYPRQLSGGQRQRVGIARALANHPNVLLCDEATSALDPETTQSILQLLRDVNRRLGLTIILIAHSMDVIRATADRLAVLDHGQIVESGAVIDVFLKPQHATTKSLLAESALEPDSIATPGWSSVARGRVLRLTYRGDAVATPLLTSLAQELGLQISILQGSVGHIGTIPYGNLIVSIDGSDDAQFARLTRALTERNVDYGVLS